MKKVLDVLKYMSRGMFWIAGIGIAFIVVLTTCDVVLRRFRIPISWAFEIITFVGAIVIGFSLPHVTLIGANVTTDFLTEKISQPWKKILRVVTRCLGVGMFAILAWRLFCLGNSFKKTGDVTPMLEIPMYPVPYIIGICCSLVCLLLIRSIFSKQEG